MVGEFLVVANWKLGGDRALVDAYRDLFAKNSYPDITTVVAMPYPYLAYCAQQAFYLAAQNMDVYTQGAYTGAVSARMLHEVGCRYVCLGHSERRRVFLESDALIAQKYVLAKQQGLQPIYCIGEDYDERAQQQTVQVLTSQLSALFSAEGFAALEKHDIIIAYEPVWAIGADQAASVADVIAAALLVQSICNRAGYNVKLCYGGSVDADNCDQYRQCENIQGLLVGRACLDIKSFERLLQKCSGC